MYFLTMSPTNCLLCRFTSIGHFSNCVWPKQTILMEMRLTDRPESIVLISNSQKMLLGIGGDSTYSSNNYWKPTPSQACYGWRKVGLVGMVLGGQALATRYPGRSA